MKKMILDMMTHISGFPVEEDTQLSDLSLDSLEFIEMLMEIEQTTGLDIRSHSLSDVRTAGELIQVAKSGIPG